MAVFLAMIVMPFSRSRSIESIMRSGTDSFWRKRPDCHSIASTSVVLPWSTWAMIAMLRTFSRCCIGPSYHVGVRVPAVRACIMTPLIIHLRRSSRMNRLILAAALVLVATSSSPAQDKPGAAPMVVFTLEKGGDITFEFFPADAPKHVENFLKLVKSGFYDGQRFHRVEPGFVAQIGDPQSKTLAMNDPKMGTGGPGYTIKAEFNSRKFDRGVLGMARRSEPDSAGSQIYIMLGAAPHLNGQYTAFGRVVSGLEIVDAIKVGDRVKTAKVK